MRGAGGSITVTYSVTVPEPPRGDLALRNRVVTPEGNCTEGSTHGDCFVDVAVALPPAPPSPITPQPIPVVG